MKRPLALLLMLFATAASATATRPLPAEHHATASNVLAREREDEDEIAQWAPIGGFFVLRARSVFEEKTRDATGPDGCEAAERAVAKRDWAYDELGRLTSHTESNGADAGASVWTYLYPGNGVVLETLPDGTQHSTTSNSRGQVTLEGLSGPTLSEAVSSLRSYDGPYLKSETRTEGNSSTNRTLDYDDFGRLVDGTESWVSTLASYRYRTSVAYSGLSGKKTHASTPGNTFTEDFLLDSLGNTVASRMADAPYSRTVYDAAGMALASLPGGHSVPTLYSYGADGRLTSKSLGTVATEVTTYAYDARGLLVFSTAPSPSGVPWNTFRVFDSLGRLTREASGNVDASGTIDSSPPSYGARVSSFAYDDLGHLVQRGDGCTSLAGALPSPSTGCVFTRFRHSPRGDLLEVTPPSGGTYSYGYDGLHRLVSVTPPLPSVQQTFRYDGLGRVTRRTLGTSTWMQSWASGAASLSTPGGDSITTLFDGRNRPSASASCPGRRPSMTCPLLTTSMTSSAHSSRRRRLVLRGPRLLSMSTDPGTCFSPSLATASLKSALATSTTGSGSR